MLHKKIVADWIGVFHVLVIRKYVNIFLSAIETEYKYHSYETLQEARVDFSLCYHGGRDKHGRGYKLKVIDEGI